MVHKEKMNVEEGGGMRRKRERDATLEILGAFSSGYTRRE
jgi:hypothetical protein